MRFIKYFKTLKEEDDTIDHMVKITIDKALSLEEPNGIIKHSKEIVDEYLSLLNYAVSLQKKELIKSEDSKSNIAILRDLEDKVDKWKDYRLNVLKIEDEPAKPEDGDKKEDDLDLDLDEK